VGRGRSLRMARRRLRWLRVRRCGWSKSRLGDHREAGEKPGVVLQYADDLICSMPSRSSEGRLRVGRAGPSQENVDPPDPHGCERVLRQLSTLLARGGRMIGHSFQ
jgi:hypothetical protein